MSHIHPAHLHRRLSKRRSEERCLKRLRPKKTIQSTVNYKHARDKLWDVFLVKKMKQNNGLKDSQGRYNRKLMYELVRDFLTTIMEVNADDAFTTPDVQRLIERYGKPYVQAWLNLKSDVTEQKILRMVQREIDKWYASTSAFERKMSYAPSSKEITSQAWENQREHIMQHIIDPFLQRQEEREAKKGLQ